MAGPGDSRQTSFDAAAEPFLRLVSDFDLYANDGEHAIIEKAAALLDRFEDALKRQGASDNALKPARYGLAMVLDQIGRSHRRIKLGTWSILARKHLFDGREMSTMRVRQFFETAEKSGPKYFELAVFLEGMLGRLETRRSFKAGHATSSWGRWAVGCVAIFLLALTAYIGFLEYRFHARITADFEAALLDIGLDRPHPSDQTVTRLTQLQDLTTRVAAAVTHAPLGRKIKLPFVDSETRAQTVYQDLVVSHVPRISAETIETILATRGDGLALYDALRAWSVLTGEGDWEPAYLQGWLEDWGPELKLRGLARHVPEMTGPSTEIVASDPEVMDQARRFAADTTETERAWLELLRAEEIRRLPDWQAADHVPGLDEVVLRRTGLPISLGIDGLFTAQGWAYADQFGIGVAVQKARRVGPGIAKGTLRTNNQTPDQMQERLHRETIEIWKAWLADLRVHPFTERDRAIFVSGTLARPDNPLTDLLIEVWRQVGGLDRQRSHQQQLLLAREFGPTIQYVEQGRMAEIARLFLSLNVALGTADYSQKRASEKLMSVQDKARSINALKGAPRIVVQITEDVLAQSTRANAAEEGNLLTQQWQQLVYPACRAVLEGQFPFADGVQADPGQVTSLLGPSGTVLQFLNRGALQFLDTEVSPWRWKPEARFEGLTPESAVFFERAVLVSEALFGPDSQMGMTLTLAALAERGRTQLSIGGQTETIRATGVPAVLNWPGPAPQAGVEVRFREAADATRLAYPGFWGLLQLTDRVRVRLRDKGQRALIDLRSAEGRVFLEVDFDKAVNPISARHAIKGFACPPSL